MLGSRFVVALVSRLFLELLACCSSCCFLSLIYIYFLFSLSFVCVFFFFLKSSSSSSFVGFGSAIACVLLFLSFSCRSLSLSLSLSFFFFFFFFVVVKSHIFSAAASGNVSAGQRPTRSVIALCFCLVVSYAVPAMVKHCWRQWETRCFCWLDFLPCRRAS